MTNIIDKFTGIKFQSILVYANSVVSIWSNDGIYCAVTGVGNTSHILSAEYYINDLLFSIRTMPPFLNDVEVEYLQETQ